MTKNNAAQSGENARRDESSLDSRYGQIGISAVAAALQSRSEVKTPAYAPAVHQPDKWIAVGGLIVPPRRRLPQAFARRVKSVRNRSGFARAALLASPLIVLARTGLIGPSLAQ